MSSNAHVVAQESYETFMAINQMMGGIITKQLSIIVSSRSGRVGTKRRCIALSAATWKLQSKALISHGCVSSSKRFFPPLMRHDESSCKFQHQLSHRRASHPPTPVTKISKTTDSAILHMGIFLSDRNPVITDAM